MGEDRKAPAACSAETVTGGGVGVLGTAGGSAGGCLANISFKKLVVGRARPMEVRDWRAFLY